MGFKFELATDGKNEPDIHVRFSLVDGGDGRVILRACRDNGQPWNVLVLQPEQPIRVCLGLPGNLGISVTQAGSGLQSAAVQRELQKD